MMDTNPDINVISASVESIISNRPKMFKTNDNVIAVAVQGVLMPYHIYVMSMIGCLHNTNSAIQHIEDDSDLLKAHMLGLYRGVVMPERYKVLILSTPWIAAERALEAIFKIIRSEDDPKGEILRMIREVEEQYHELYIKPQPAYSLEKNVMEYSKPNTLSFTLSFLDTDDENSDF